MRFASIERPAPGQALANVLEAIALTILTIEDMETRDAQHAGDLAHRLVGPAVVCVEILGEAGLVDQRKRARAVGVCPRLRQALTLPRGSP